MQQEHVSALARVIREEHGAEPIFRFVTHVSEASDGKDGWAGLVYVFDLAGNPTANRCYGVVCSVDNSAPQLTIILQDGAIQSAADAVRAHSAHKRGKQ